MYVNWLNNHLKRLASPLCFLVLSVYILKRRASELQLTANTRGSGGEVIV